MKTRERGMPDEERWKIASQERKESVEMDGWGFGWGMMMIGGLVMLLFWGIVIALAIWGIRALIRSEGNREGGRLPTLQTNDALEILKQRYARGEISREEYQNMRRDLEGQGVK